MWIPAVNIFEPLMFAASLTKTISSNAFPLICPNTVRYPLNVTLEVNIRFLLSLFLALSTVHYWPAQKQQRC